MPAKVKLRGRVFGQLTVVSEAGRDKWGAVLWLCQCECGNTPTRAGNFHCDSRGRMKFTEQESWGFEWGRDDAHDDGAES